MEAIQKLLAQGMGPAIKDASIVARTGLAHITKRRPSREVCGASGHDANIPERSHPRFALHETRMQPDGLKGRITRRLLD